MTRVISTIIVRPPRRKYSETELRDITYLNDSRPVTRVPVTFTNSRGENIVGSMYPAPRSAENNPCVIYLHGNASSQIEGSYLVTALAPKGINLLCIDTSGCGNSDGEIISLGLREKDDVKAAIQYIKREFEIQHVIIWGRSMGAAIAAWYAAEEGDLDGIIVDSAYCSVREIAEDLCGNNWFLWGLMKLLYPLVRRNVQKDHGFSIDDINVIDKVQNARCPALFVHANHDTFINIREARELYSRYGGEKYMITTTGNHNSVRPLSIKTTELMFISRIFGINDKFSNIDNTEHVNDNSNAHFENAFEMIRNL